MCQPLVLGGSGIKQQLLTPQARKWGGFHIHQRYGLKNYSNPKHTDRDGKSGERKKERQAGDECVHVCRLWMSLVDDHFLEFNRIWINRTLECTWKAWSTTIISRGEFRVIWDIFYYWDYLEKMSQRIWIHTNIICYNYEIIIMSWLYRKIITV